MTRRKPMARTWASRQSACAPERLWAYWRFDSGVQKKRNGAVALIENPKLTKERAMMVLRPAAMAGLRMEVGTRSE